MQRVPGGKVANWWRRWIDFVNSSADEAALEYLSNGRRGLAVRYFRQRLREQRKRLGWEHRETLITACYLGAACREAGQIEESLLVLTRTHDHLQQLFGAQNTITVLCATEMAASRYAAGDRDAATKLLTEMLDEQERLSDKNRDGYDYVKLLLVRCRLASIYRAEGKLFDSFTLMKYFTPELYADVLGPRHPATLRAETIWPDFTAAIARMTESFNNPERFPLSANDRAAVSMTKEVERNITTRGTRDGEKFQELYGRVAKLWGYARRWYETHDGADHLNTLEAMRNEAEGLSLAGDGAAAIALQQTVYAGLGRALGPDHYDTTKAGYALAHYYYRHGRVPESITLAERIVEVWTATRGPSDSDTLRAISIVAYGLYATGRRSEAEPMLRHLEDNGWQVRASDE